MSFEYGLNGFPVDRQSGYHAPAQIDRPHIIGGKNGTGTDSDAGGSGFSFGDLVDVLNPLQHIPVVSTLYRRLTGDEIDPMSRVAGGALFGGWIGGVASVANALIERATGDDLGGHIATAFLGDGEETDTAQPATAVQLAARPTDDEPQHHASQGVADSAQTRPPLWQLAAAPTGARPIAMDQQTFDALARTLGGTDAIAHLDPQGREEKVPPPPPRPPIEEKPAPALTLADSAPHSERYDAAARIGYQDALIRMQAAFNQYEAQRGQYEAQRGERGDETIATP